MSNNIDVSEIMKELEEKIKKGLSNKQMTVTDISKLIGEHLDKTKEKVLQDVGKVVEKEIVPSNEDTCVNCGGRLKKTKK